MTDILKRVTAARKEATYAFLKESTTHELAKVIRDAMYEIKISLSQISGVSTDDIDNEKSLMELVSLHLKEGFMHDPHLKGYPFLDRIKNLLQNQDKMLHARLLKLHEHFYKAHAISSGSAERDGIDAERIRRVNEHLDGMYEDAVERALRMERNALYELDHGESQPEVLILQGGGAKGFAYSGVVEHLEDRGLLRGITKVGGTSAGSLMALPIALGYSSEEIQEIVHNGRFAQFFYEGSVVFKSLTKLDKMTSDKDPNKLDYLEGHLLADFAFDYMLPSLEMVTETPVGSWKKMNEQELQRILQELDEKGILQKAYVNAVDIFNADLREKGRENEIGILDFGPLLSRSKYFQASITAIRMARSDAHPDSEIIEAFIGDIIQAKIQLVPAEIRHAVEPALTTTESIRNINFSQLKQLVELYPRGNFKEFGVAVTDSYAPVTPVNAVRYAWRMATKIYNRMTNGDNPDDGIGVYDKHRAMKPLFVRANNGEHGYIDMPIKKAVRASMNLPVVFKPVKHGYMRLIDGGLTNNFPHRLFRDSFTSPEEANKKTIGFMLSTIEADIETRQINEMVRSAKKKPNIIIEEHTMRSEGKRNKGALQTVFSKMTAPMKKAFNIKIGKQIENIMGFYNTSTPSIEEMDNVGIINTGLVGTSEFNLSRESKLQLHRAGVYASINLNNLDADKDLRFATGRLVSLTNIEHQLLNEMNHSPQKNESIKNNLFYKVYDADTMIAALERVNYSSWDLSDVLMGRPLAKGSPDGVCFDNICFPDIA